MGQLFGGKPKAVEAPPLPPPPPPPPTAEEDGEAGEWAKRLARRKRGFLGTIKAGALEPGSTGKKTVLG